MGTAANWTRSGSQGHRFKTRCQQRVSAAKSSLKSALLLVICINNFNSCVRWIGWLFIWFTCERCDTSSINKRSTRVVATLKIRTVEPIPKKFRDFGNPLFPVSGKTRMNFKSPGNFFFASRWKKNLSRNLELKLTWAPNRETGRHWKCVNFKWSMVGLVVRLALKHLLYYPRNLIDRIIKLYDFWQWAWRQMDPTARCRL